MTNLRVGVIGTGIMGTDHARILDRFVSGATVTQVTDADATRAQAVAAQLRDAGVTADALALISDPEVDAVVIASADSTHGELVLAAARAGKPMLCEKPLAPTLDEAAHVVRTLDSGGRTHLLSLGFMRRFDPGYVELAQALADGECGAPVLVHCVSRGISAAVTTQYSVTGAAVHEFDTVPWLLGSPITEVCWLAGRSSSHAPGKQDPQLTLLRTADGVLTTVEAFLNARYGYDIRCEVVGELGTLALTEQSRTIRELAGRRSVGHAADWRQRFGDAYRLELQAWVDHLVHGAASELATAHDGLVASAVSHAVLRSMAGGGIWTTVEVPDPTTAGGRA